MKKQSLIKGSIVLGLAGILAKVLGFFFRWPLIMLKVAVRHRKLGWALCDDLEGCDGGDDREVQGGDICMHTADSCWTAETNTTL